MQHPFERLSASTRIIETAADLPSATLQGQKVDVAAPIFHRLTPDLLSGHFIEILRTINPPTSNRDLLNLCGAALMEFL